MFKAFGKNPAGNELAKIKRSTNYRNGAFQNLSSTSVMTEDTSFFKALANFLNKPKDSVPPGPLPFIKMDLHSLKSDKPVIIWFGHSSYFIRIEGKNILVDPVFSGNASPFTFAVKSFKGSDVFQSGDMPEIDVMIITHDHYDHLDYKTFAELKNKVKLICTPLGVGSHLAYWGFDPSRIIEFDWWNIHHIHANMQIIATPARHFSGRLFARGKTLWSAFILQTREYKLFLGGDGGYDHHFKSIGAQYGPFDLAILEAGQYNTSWPQIHMMPEETVQAAIDLKTKVLLPVHWGKFALAFHSWNEPIKRLTEKAKTVGLEVTTPRIGEPVVVGENYPHDPWWHL